MTPISRAFLGAGPVMLAVSPVFAGLAHLGPAADFTLQDENGRMVSRADFDGTVVLVSFIFTRCGDVCPLLSSKLSDISDELANDGRSVHFITITVDPVNDTPEVLKEYAENLDYDPTRWSFLTGTPEEVTSVAHDYGVFMDGHPHGTVQHSLLTTLVDREGIMRVQYLGEKFDPSQLLDDLHALTD